MLHEHFVTTLTFLVIIPFQKILNTEISWPYYGSDELKTAVQQFREMRSTVMFEYALVSAEVMPRGNVVKSTFKKCVLYQETDKELFKNSDIHTFEIKLRRSG